MLHIIKKTRMFFCDYGRWIKQNEKTDARRRKEIKFARMPKVTVITAAFNPSPHMLRYTMKSVLNQTYPNWEFCIAGCGISYNARNFLAKYGRKDDRIKTVLCNKTGGIASGFNESIRISAGEYACFLDQGDILAPGALFEIVKKINETDTDIIYSDEDTFDAFGIRTKPVFKPDWSPDFLKSCNYITHLLVIKTGLLEEIGGFRDGFDGSQYYDLILRATEKTNRIAHIPKILYHRRHSPGPEPSDTESKPRADENGRRALEEHFRRTEPDGTVAFGMESFTYHATYKIHGSPRVSIIISNTDHRTELENCINSVLDRSTYGNYEIMIAENNSTEKATFDYYEKLEKHQNIKLLTWNNPFNYASINNFCAGHASGDFLLFLNNDTKVISPDWIEKMLEHAQKKAVGVVGAKLYYADNTIQHAGVIIPGGGWPLHAFRHFHREDSGYMNRMRTIQNYSAVTAACMLTGKRIFEEVGGFDERFAFDYNDIDFCLKTRERGYLVVWTPYAELYHYESRTRGPNNTKPKKALHMSELALFMEKWHETTKKGDPYYNPNLRFKKADFSLNIKP